MFEFENSIRRDISRNTSLKRLTKYRKPERNDISGLARDFALLYNFLRKKIKVIVISKYLRNPKYS